MVQEPEIITKKDGVATTAHKDQDFISFEATQTKLEDEQQKNMSHAYTTMTMQTTMRKSAWYECI